MGALAYRYQHDVNDPDCAQSQRDHSYRAEKHIHDVKNGVHHFRLLDGIPFVEGIHITGIESVVGANDFMNVILCKLVFGGDARLIFDKGNRVLMIFALYWEGRPHYLEGNVATHIEPHVVAAA